VQAWQSIVNDPEKRAAFQRARGKGGFRRVRWDEALELISASVVHTVKQYGPDRVIGFSPIPAMSQVSYASGSRFLSLLGGTVLSFYDWYCDLPPASPEVWGEQTDVHESADWYNSRFIAVMGANLNMTRTPDAHFISEVRHAGAKLTVFSPTSRRSPSTPITGSRSTPGRIRPSGWPSITCCSRNSTSTARCRTSSSI